MLSFLDSVLRLYSKDFSSSFPSQWLIRLTLSSVVSSLLLRNFCQVMSLTFDKSPYSMYGYEILDLSLTVCEITGKFRRGLSSGICCLCSFLSPNYALPWPGGEGTVARKEIVLKNLQLEAGSEIPQISKYSLFLCYLPTLFNSI